MQDFLEGTILEIVFTNESNGFTVCTVTTSDGSEVTAVGSMPGLSVGESVRLSGSWTSHIDYGEQFKAKFYEKIAPSSETQILLYLSSGIIKGIGASTAQKIVNKFGAESLEVIRDDPKKLASIKGISLAKAMTMQESYLEKQNMQSVIMFLQPYGISANFALKVYRKFGTNAVNLIQKDPYILCDIHGIGFKTADTIAQKMGISPSNESRLRNGIKYVLMQYAQNGHTYLRHEDLLRISVNILGGDEISVASALTGMLLDGSLIREEVFSENAIYLPIYYNAEAGVARRLSAKLCEQNSKLIKDFDKKIMESENKLGITLSDMQREACRLAVECGIVIITGGPGTGKTTVINTIISLVSAMGLEIALCAPTGRAAKRLSEMCEIEAKTIHRLLEINFLDNEENQVFSRDQENPLEEDVVIVDEMSMVDIMLMNGLVKALKPGCKLIMAGDADQLPSVGAGNVLKDMIESGKIPVVRLDEIYRQAAESMIIVNAHRINKGEKPILNKRDKDFFFIEKINADDILETLTSVCCQRLKKAYGYDPMSDIQVLTPARKTVLGVLELNRKLQERLNPKSDDKKEKKVGEVIFREGDKVMQIKNNYNIAWENIQNGLEGEGAFNGDIGIISKINNSEQYVEVIFDGERKIRYDFLLLDEIELAYAITVHKSQGSEFKAVVVPLYNSAPQLMNRNLFYTALTRAREMVVLIGRENIMYKMIENNSEAKRFSGLRSKIERICL